MVVGTLRNSIPKSVVYCQVREAKRSLLDHFFTDLGKKEVIPSNAFTSLTSIEKIVFSYLPVETCILFLFLQAKQLGNLLDEDPAIMQRRISLAKRLELYRSAQAEIDAVAWAK